MQRQLIRSPIKVIIANPAVQCWPSERERQQQKNRKYKLTDKRVAETYAKDSKATNKNALSDPYVKAIRWASDRIIKNGVAPQAPERALEVAEPGDRHRLVDGAPLACPMNAVMDVATPVIVRLPLGISWMYTPG